MELSGQVMIGAPAAVVWDALFDPQVLQLCIPGCKRVERTGDRDYAAVMALKIGPLSATFNANITLEDPEYPVQVRLTGAVQGAGAGFTKGHAVVRLVAVEGGTELQYTGDVKVGGKLATVGDRVFGAAVRKNITSFFGTLGAKIEATPTEVGSAADHIAPVH